MFIINCSSLLPDRPEANTVCCHVIHLDIYANIQYVTHALVSSPSIFERFIRTRTCSRSAVVRRIIYWLRVSGVCVRMASMSYRHSFVLVLYRCISDRRREGAECSGSLVVYNARVCNKASCSLSAINTSSTILHPSHMALNELKKHSGYYTF